MLGTLSAKFVCRVILIVSQHFALKIHAALWAVFKRTLVERGRAFFRALVSDLLVLSANNLRLLLGLMVKKLG